MPEAILFDFGQTLVDSATGFRFAEKTVQEKIFQHCRNVAWNSFIEGYRQIRSAHHSRSLFSRFDIWRMVAERFGLAIKAETLVGWEDEYWRQVSARTRPFTETREVISQLAVEYRLGLITNTQGQAAGAGHRLADFPELAPFFEIIVVAGESGVAAKPDAAPFVRCLAELRLAARAALFVGDDWRIDVCGARAAGMPAVWLQHHSVLRRWPDVQNRAPIITSLAPLLDANFLRAVDRQYSHECG